MEINYKSILKTFGQSMAQFGDTYPEIINSANIYNPWFTEDNIKRAAKAWSQSLSENAIDNWLSKYPVGTAEAKVGIIMAGNIPWVGLHDLLCAFVSGGKVVCKLSSQDEVLMKWAIQELITLGDLETDEITIVGERIGALDKLIATGSNNSSRYFDYYFKSIPRLIRKNRSSVAVLEADASPEEMKLLGQDIFSYFGLGCRNVGKVFLPKEFDVVKLIDAFEPYMEVINHHKYANNYTYHKAILLMNLDKHLDNGFMIFQEKEDLLKPPLSQLFYSFYENKQKLFKDLESNEEIQCIVSRENIPFGAAQFPQLADYADHADTLAFLLK